MIQRSTNPYAHSTIEELRKKAATDPAAVEELRSRFEAMSDVQLERYARTDPLAQSIYATRNIAPKAAAGQGRFSSSGVQSLLEQDIQRERARLQAEQGITRRSASPVNPGAKTEGGTIAALRTDVPGFEDRSFIGRSPQAGGKVNLDSRFAPPTDIEKLPQTHGHAEQGLADQLADALREIPKEKLKGRKVWILVEQEPCSTCAQGIADPTVEAGVLQKLRNEFPELSFEIRSIDSSALLKLGGVPGAGEGSPGAAGLAEEGTPKSGAPSVAENIPPPELTPKAGALPKGKLPGLGPEGEGVGPKLPGLGETEVPGLAPRSLGGSSLGRIGAAAAEGALNIALEVALLATQIILELVILPKIRAYLQALENKRRAQIQEQVQKRFEAVQAKQIGRLLKSCFLKKIRALEQAGKTAYVNVVLNVSFEDTSNRIQLFHEKPPDSFFDVEFNDVDLVA